MKDSFWVDYAMGRVLSVGSRAVAIVVGGIGICDSMMASLRSLMELCMSVNGLRTRETATARSSSQTIPPMKVTGTTTAWKDKAP